TAISPLYRPRSRMNGQTYTSDSAVTTQATTLSTSAMVSRTNMPPRTVPCPPTPQAISAATASSATMARALVTARCFSSTNRSSISNAKAAPTSTSSGSSGSSSAAVGMVGIIRRASSELACGELARQLRDGGFHQVGQRLRPDADQQHAGGESAQHDPLAHVDVLHLRDIGIADVAPDDALGQPQRVGRAGDQGRRHVE